MGYERKTDVVDLDGDIFDIVELTIVGRFEIGALAHADRSPWIGPAMLVYGCRQFADWTRERVNDEVSPAAIERLSDAIMKLSGFGEDQEAKKNA